MDKQIEANEHPESFGLNENWDRMGDLRRTATLCNSGIMGM